ncbi:hypothetical protein ACFZAI_03370 [Achromobacter sp. NPDC008082]|uniref:hypothetical protein n=1 Tax=Achromobacter sp. NPDC008082 TaxID=3363888 RepID=UPI0036F0D603
MPKLLLRVCDFLLLAGAAALFGACLTSLLTTDTYGWVVPDAPYIYTARDFYADAALAGLAGLLVLVVAERFAAARQTPAWRVGLTFLAALLALYLAPPAPVVFGNTWASGEATRELFLAQWRLVLPIALAVTAARWVLRRVFVR